MKKRTEKRRFSDSAIAALLALLLLLAAGELIGGIIVDSYTRIAAAKAAQGGAELAAGGELFSPAVTAALNYLHFIGIWIAALLWFLIRKNRYLYAEISGKKSGNTFRMLLLGLLTGFVMNGLCVLAAWLNRDIELYFDSFRLPGLLLVFVCIFIQSSAEELLTRVFLYQKLLKRYKKPVIAAVGNAVVFSLLHVSNDGVTVLALVNIVLTGTLFSMMVYYFDSVWMTFGVHAAWNFNQNIVFGLPNSGMVSPFSVFRLDASAARDSFAYNVGFGVESTLFATFIIVLTGVLILLWARKHGKPGLFESASAAAEEQPETLNAAVSAELPEEAPPEQTGN